MRLIIFLVYQQTIRSSPQKAGYYCGSRGAETDMKGGSLIKCDAQQMALINENFV